MQSNQDSAWECVTQGSKIPTWGFRVQGLGFTFLGIPIIRIIILGVYIGVPLFWETTIWGLGFWWFCNWTFLLKWAGFPYNSTKYGFLVGISLLTWVCLSRVGT